MRRYLAITALAAASACAQTIDSPTAGYLYNKSTAAIHPITGIPGAATLGHSVLAGVESASFSPASDSAVVTKSGAIFLVTAVHSRRPKLEPLADSGTALTAWGRNTAIIYTNSTFRLLTAQGDLETLAIGLPAEATINAIDYDETAQRLYIASTAGVHAFSITEGTLTKLFSAANPTSLARVAKTIYALEANTITTENGPLSLTLDPETKLTAIAASSDGTHLYLADAGKNQILQTDLQGTITATIPSPASPEKLERQGNLLVLNTNQPFYLLTDTATPAIFFIPSLTTESKQKREGR